MTAFTKFTASVAGLAAACTLSLATPAFAGPHGSPGGPGFSGPGVHHPAPPPRPAPPPHHRHRTTATVPGTAMTTPGSGLRSPPVLSFTE